MRSGYGSKVSLQTLLICATALISGLSHAPHALGEDATAITLSPSSMRRIGSVDDRCQSYNIEMLELTGGVFWKPYNGDAKLARDRQQPTSPAAAGDTPAGMDPNAYAYRPPIDLSSTRRRKLAAALGPTYVRVSGTWANTTYFPESDEAPEKPPAGFNGVLTRQQWKGL
jgi:heparanase 1